MKPGRWLSLMLLPITTDADLKAFTDGFEYTFTPDHTLCSQMQLRIDAKHL